MKPPKGQRIGQAIWNFTFWLEEKGIDIFYVPDKELEELYKEWLKTIK